MPGVPAATSTLHAATRDTFFVSGLIDPIDKAVTATKTRDRVPLEYDPRSKKRERESHTAVFAPDSAEFFTAATRKRGMGVPQARAVTAMCTHGHLERENHTLACLVITRCCGWKTRGRFLLPDSPIALCRPHEFQDDSFLQKKNVSFWGMIVVKCVKRSYPAARPYSSRQDRPPPLT